MLPTLAALASALSLATPTVPSVPPPEFAYPATRRDDTVDDYFGTKVADPYRWLEDDNAPATAEWVKAENAVTEAYLVAIPERARIRDRLTRAWDYERVSNVVREGKRTFYSRNTGLQPQSVLYVTDDPAKDGRVLLDPNALSKDGTVALAGTRPSRDGRWLAYGVSDAGSDWQVWRIRGVDDGADLPDELRWVKWGGIAWKKDGSGFFYSRYPAPREGEALTAPNRNHQVWFHRRGTPQSSDALVYERPDEPDWGFGSQVSDDGRWLVISAHKGTSPDTAVFVLDLARKGARPEPLLPAMDAMYDFVAVEGDRFLFVTDKDAPRRRLVAIPRGKGDPGRWTVVIPEGKGRDVLESVDLVGDRLVATWMRDVKSAVEVMDLRGRKVGEVSLPGIGTVTGFHGRRGYRETYYEFKGFLAPPTTYRLDVRTLASRPFRLPKVDFDPSPFEVEQVFYPSRDGTRIPMFLLHRKGMKRDGTNPTILYGYGGFNIPLTPTFSVARAVWLEMGGTYAIANIRGGGEYGKEWHDAARGPRRQVAFDDFIAAAEWLKAEGVTSTERLAVNGGSNGGLLVGAVMTQRPDLVAVALPQVGVMDMLRFHRFTIGWAWKSDFGSSETKEGFEVLRAYSPLHNLRSGVAYPATLVTTADHDDRVVPAHSFKFIAALQAAQAGSRPVMARIETRAGHGAGKPTGKIIEETADVLGFTLRNLSMTLPAGFGAGR